MSARYPGWRSYDRPPEHLLADPEKVQYVVTGPPNCSDVRVSRAWEGKIAPFAACRDIAQVISALAEDRYILIGQDGELDVYGDDPPERLLHLPSDTALRKSVFLLRATYNKPPAHPRVVLLHPAPSRQALREIHFWPDGSICALFPPDNTWDWNRPDFMADYLDAVAIWLGKYSYWEFTLQYRGRGLWVGSDVPHDPRLAWAKVRPGDQCLCGSGLRVRDCCGKSVGRSLTSGAYMKNPYYGSSFY